MHPFIVMINKPKPAAKQTELFRSEWTCRQLTSDEKQTLTPLGLISFPTLSVTPSIDWLLCFQLEPLFYQSHPPLFQLLFLLLSTAPSDEIWGPCGNRRS